MRGAENVEYKKQVDVGRLARIKRSEPATATFGPDVHNTKVGGRRS